MTNRRLSALVLLIGGVIATLLLWSRRDYVPMWDGRIYADCIAKAASNPRVLAGYRCGGHISESYVALLAFAARLAPGTPTAPLVANALLILAGAVALWRLMRSAFPADEHRVGRALVVAAFVVHPIVLAAAVQPGLDIGLLVFSLCALAAAVEDRRWTLVLFGILLVFAKEPGVVLYGVIVAAWMWRRCAHHIAEDEHVRLGIAALALFAFLSLAYSDVPSALFFLAVLGIVALRPRSPSRRMPKGIGATLLREWPVVVPVLLLAAYLAVHAIQSASARAAGSTSDAATQPVVWGGSSATDLLVALARPGVFDPNSKTTFALVFVVGFLWIPSLVLLVDLAVGAVRCVRAQPARELPGANVSALAFITAVFVADAWLLSRFVTFSNARYYLPAYPLALVATYAALVRLKARPVQRGALMATIGVLLAVSAERTIDPVSRALWGTFDVGDRSLLRVTSISKECCGLGRDQLTYNLEFTAFASLQDRLFEQLQPSASTVLVLPNLADWYTVELVDSATHHRTMRPQGSVRPKALNAADAYALGDLGPSAWYMDMPYMLDAIFPRLLSKRYEFGEPCQVTFGGYRMIVRQMRLRASPLASPSSAALSESDVARAPDCTPPARALLAP